LAKELLPSNDRQRKTYILLGGKLTELPEGLMFVAPTRVGPLFRSSLFSLSGKARLALSAVLPRPARWEQDVSVADFIRQRLGEEALERLAEPLLAAVYGADVNSLSARATLPQLMGLEEKYGSLWRGFRALRRAARGAEQSRPASGLFTTLRNGVGDIIKALENNVPKTRVVLQREVVTVSRREPGAGFGVEWQGGGMEAAALILAVPAHAAARILRGLDARLAHPLSEIPYHSSLIVSLGFAQSKLPRPLDGFGFVVPRGEGKRLVACTWVSTKFPFRSEPGQALLRCFLGGARDPAILQEQDGRIFQIVLGELAEIMDLRAEPVLGRIYRWKNCMPQYQVGHLRRMEEMAGWLEEHPGLFLAGNGYRGVGIPDCIQSSSAAAAAALRYLQTLP
jgi:oxygen-dependent protoporphyrinogen oxidase